MTKSAIIERRNLRMGKIVFFVFLVALFAGCASGEDGIFAVIESEVKTPTGNLIDNAPGIGIVPYTDGSQRYYIAAIGVGKLFYRGESVGSNWQELNGTGAGNVSAIASLGADGTTLYAVSSGTLYAYTGIPGSGTWTTVSSDFDADTKTDTIYSMASIDSDLDGTPDTLVGTVIDSDEESIKNSNGDIIARRFYSGLEDGTGAVAHGFLGTVDDIAHTAVVSGDLNPASANALLVFVGVRKGLFTIEIPDLATPSVTVARLSGTDALYPAAADSSWSGTNLSGVAYAGAGGSFTDGVLLISDLDNGYVYGFDGAWTRSNPVSDATAPILVLTDPSATTNGLALVGTQSTASPSNESANGYYEVVIAWDATASTMELTLEAPVPASYSSSTISDAAILSFAKNVNATDGKTDLFASTVGDGIWNIQDYSSASEWRWE